MEIDSAKYYSIILSRDHIEAGASIIDDILTQLKDSSEDKMQEDLESLGESPYRFDIQSLIGFSSVNDEYTFATGGLCHVIGHQVRPAIKIVLQAAKTCDHPHCDALEQLHQRVNDSTS